MLPRGPCPQDSASTLIVFFTNIREIEQFPASHRRFFRLLFSHGEGYFAPRAPKSGDRR